MIDTVELMLGNQVSLLSSHLSIAGPSGSPIYPWLQSPTVIVEMKNSAGWPADVYGIGKSLIYQIATEVDDNAGDYQNPKSYRQFVSQTWKADPASQGGIPWMPRKFNPGGPAVVIEIPDTSYVTVRNGVKSTTLRNLGPAEVQFEGPFNDVDFEGVVGRQPYYLHSYRYNPGFSAQEQNCYVMGLGRVRWQLFALVGGTYQVTQTSLFNTASNGPVPILAWKPL